MKNSCGGRGCRVTKLPKDNKIRTIKSNIIKKTIRRILNKNGL